MKPTQVTDRSSGARLRQAGAVVMVGTTMASPRSAAITRRASSGLSIISASRDRQAVSSPTSTAAGPRRARLRR